MKKKLPSIAALTMLIATGMISCKKDFTPEMEPNDVKIIDTISWALKEEFNKMIHDSTLCLPPVQAINTAQTNGPSYDTTYNYQHCTITPYKFAPGYDEVMIFSPNEVMHVGGWLDGSGIQNGSWSTVPVANFDTATISISLSTTTGSLASAKVANPASHSSYVNAHNKLLQHVNPNSTPAYVSWDMEKIYSYDQVVAKIGVNAGGWGAKIAGSYEFSKTNIKSRFLIRLIQKYYTVDLDIPTEPSDWFTALPDFNKLKNYCPTFISSICYGRMVYVVVESESSFDSLQTALSGSYNGYGANFSFTYNSANFTGIKNMTIKGFVVGGSTSFLTGDLNDIGNIISSGSHYSVSSPGVPIAFTVRKLSTNGIVNFVTMSEYNVEECTIIGVPATVHLNSGVEHTFCPARYNGDDDFGGCVDINGDITLELRNANTEIWAKVDVNFNECASGDTKSSIDPSLSGNSIYLYTAPLGQYITSIDVHQTSHFAIQDPEDGDYTPFNIPVTSSFIDHIRAVGDTDGDDLPCDGSDERAYLKVYFKNFDITLSHL